MMVASLSPGRRALASVVLLAAVASCVGRNCIGQEASDATSPSINESPTFRRVFVPADRPEDWPTRGEQYLPMGRVQFERLAEAAEAGRQLQAAGAVHIAAATYEAKFATDGTLTGSASFDVKLVDAVPRVLKLAPWNIAVHEAYWSGGENEANEALLGAWTRPGEKVAQYGVLVRKNGVLEVKWAASATPRGGPDYQFALELPTAVSQRLALVLPAGCTASIVGGRLVEKAEAADAATVRWTFQVGSGSPHRLRVRRPASEVSQATSKWPLIAVSEAYAIAPQGLDYEAEFRVQQRDAPTGEFRVAVPASLHVTDVSVDRQPVPWRQGEDASPAVSIPLTASTAPVTVTLKAAAALVTDTAWELPHVTPQSCFWTEGTSTLWVDPALELQSIVPRGGSLLNVVGVGRAEGGEAYRLQGWSGEASTEIVVAEKSPEVRSANGVSVQFAGRELIGRCRSEVWAEKGHVFHMTAGIERNWTVEAIESTPADAIHQWHVTEAARGAQLHLHLRRSPTALEPLRLTVTARKPLRGLRPDARLAELDWIRFPNTLGAASHLLLSPPIAGRGEELLPSPRAADAVVTVDSLSAKENELFDDPADGLLLDRGRMDRDGMIRVASAPARFQGEAWVELARTPAGFEHRTEIMCRPMVGAVGEVLVAMSRAVPPDAQWTIVDSDEQPVVQPVGARLAQRAGGDAASARPAEYRVRLADPRSGAFRLRVTWRGTDSTADSVNRVSLRGAETWQAWAILRGDPRRTRVDPRGCPPAAAAPNLAVFEGVERPELIGCYRLIDEPTASSAAAPLLTVAPPRAPAIDRRVTCSLLETTTLQFADGHQTHRLVYHLDVNGRQNVDIIMPEGVAISDARLDERTAPINRLGKERIRARIELPADQRLITLALDLQSTQSPPGFGAEVTPPAVETSFPVMRGTWTLAAPPQYQIAESDRASVRTGVLKRLFGPFAAGSRASTTALGLSRASAADGTHASAAMSSAPSTPSGWTSASQSFVSAPQPVRLRLREGTSAAWYVSGLISAVAAALLWPRASRWVGAAATTAALGCLVLPTHSYLLAQAVFLGALLGMIARQVMARTQGVATTQPSWRTAAAALAMGLTAATCAISAAAAESRPVPPAVFFPIDADGKPAGTDVYVPAPLVSKLLPSPEAARNDGAASVLIRAHYELELQRESTDGDLVVGQGALRFVWQTFRGNVRAELPLVREEAEWLTEQHTLNGQPVALSWDELGERCSVDLAEPGTHVLQLKLSPKVRPLSARNQLQLHLPSAPGATVEINHPPGVEGLAVTSAVITAVSPTRWSGHLTAAEALEVSWPGQPRVVMPRATVEQLSWLEVDPVASRLDVRLRLAGDAVGLDRLQLAVSPQLKLLPLPEDAPVAHLQTIPGSPTIVELRFRRSPQLPMTLALPFEIQRMSSVGRIDFPLVHVLNADTKSHHFAVSADSRLRVREAAGSGLSPAADSEIEALWGPLRADSTLQYAVAAADPVWSMSVERFPSRFTARETVDLLCASDGAELTYAAAISDVEGEVLVHRLEVPVALSIDDVSVSADGQEGPAPIRWTRSRPDQLSVFLGRPLTAAHTLRVSGRMSYAEGRRLPIPRIGLPSSAATAMVVRVRRSSDVLVQWSSGAQPPMALPITTAVKAGEGLPVGQYAHTRSAGTTSELVLTPNLPQFKATAVLALDTGEAEPTITCTIRGEVTGGVVDYIDLLTDSNWRGPLTVEPPGSVEKQSAAGRASRQRVRVHLAQPVAAGDHFVVHVKGPIALEGDQRIRFPSVQALGAASRDTFLLVPDESAGSGAEWTLSGLSRERLPAALAEAIGQTPPPMAHRVLSERFAAEQRVFPTAIRAAAIRLADVHVTVDRLGHWSAVAEMIVQPGGAAELAVGPPPGAALVFMEVDGRAIVAPFVLGGAWQLPSGPRYLPRVVTVGYRKNSADGRRRAGLELPQIFAHGEPLAILKSLWRIDGDPSLRLATLNSGRVLAAEDFAAAVRRERIEALLDASPLAFQLHPLESQQWFQPWLARLGSGDERAARKAQDREAAWSRLSDRVTALQGSFPAPGQVAPRGVGRLDSTPQGSAFYEGGRDGKLTLTAGSSGEGSGRWLTALAVAAAWAVAWRRPQKIEPLLAAARRWPSALGVAAGLAWWLAFTPSLLGPVIMALSLAAFYKSRQAGRAARPPQRDPHDENTVVADA